MVSAPVTTRAPFSAAGLPARARADLAVAEDDDRRRAGLRRALASTEQVECGAGRGDDVDAAAGRRPRLAERRRRGLVEKREVEPERALRGDRRRGVRGELADDGGGGSRHEVRRGHRARVGVGIGGGRVVAQVLVGPVDQDVAAGMHPGEREQAPIGEVGDAG